MPTYHAYKHSANDDAILDKVLQYLAKEEGFSDKPYLDPNGKQWNIGYGSKIDTNKPGWKNQRLSKEQGLKRLKDDYIKHRNYAQDALERHGYKNPSGRVLDGLGLLFFNTAWGELANSKRLREAAQTAARGNEDPLVVFARSINTVDGKYNSLIDARRKAENAYMTGGSLGGEKVEAKKTLKWNKDAMKTPTPNPTKKPEPPIPAGVAQSKEGASVWDRLKNYRDEAVDSFTGGMTSLGKWGEEQLAKYRGEKGETPKPTSSSPIAAAEANEPAVSSAGLPSADAPPSPTRVPTNAEEIQRIAAKYVQDVISDPQVLAQIKSSADRSGESFEDEMLKTMWAANNPSKPMPENITEVSQIAQQISPKSEDYVEKWKAVEKAVPEDDATKRVRELARRKWAERQKPATVPSPSAVQ